MWKRNKDFTFKIKYVSRFSGNPLIRTEDIDYNDTYSGVQGTLENDDSVEDGYLIIEPDASAEFEIYEDGADDPAIDYDTTDSGEESTDEITVDMDYIDEFEEYYTDNPCEAYMAYQGEGSFGING